MQYDGTLTPDVTLGEVFSEQIEVSRPVEQRAVRLAAVAAGRFGIPGEVGDHIEFLASARAGFVTGQNIAIEGGQIKGLW